MSMVPPPRSLQPAYCATVALLVAGLGGIVLLYCALYWRGGGAVQAAAARCRVCTALDDVWGARFTMATLADPDCRLSHAGWNKLVWLTTAAVGGTRATSEV